MIKKIELRQLRKGMYVHDFNLKSGSCDKNIRVPKALISSDAAVKIIQSYTTLELYIDLDKGVDVLPEKSLKSTTFNRHYAPQTPLNEELKPARSIKHEAIHIINKTIQSVSGGGQLHVNEIVNLTKRMEKSISRNRDALLLLTQIKQKDQYTLLHSISVCTLALAFSNYCKLDYEQTIKIATGAMLHDIGKTQIPLEILNKPGKLSQKEYELIKRHADHSVELLGKTRGLPTEVSNISLHHHERYDGTGYPFGLSGVNIDFGSRLVAICDVYDAMTSNRCYKNASNRIQSLKKLYDMSETHFDKEMTYNFIKFVGVYPVGTCVKLSNGISCIVYESTEDVLRPIVQTFYDDVKQQECRIEKINLTNTELEIIGYEFSTSEWSKHKRALFSKIRRALISAD